MDEFENIIEKYMNELKAFSQQNTQQIKPKDMPYIRENYSITDEEAEAILHFKRQQGMLITNGDNMQITLNASQREYQAFNDGTDAKYGKQKII